MQQLAEVATLGEIDANKDPLLEQCFAEHSAYKDILSRQRFLILGRKGAGKTAMFRRLKRHAPDRTTVIGFSHRDFPWDFHGLQLRVGTPDADAYVQSWTYLMLLTWAKLLINEDRTRPRDAAQMASVRALKRFVMDSYGSTKPSLTEIFSTKTVLKLHPEFTTATPGSKISLKPQSVPIENLPRFINEINQSLLRHVFAATLADWNYLIAFDELDFGYKPGDSEYRDRLIGLIRAAWLLNSEARDNSSGATAILFLRSDIYDQLQFQDKNKITKTEVSRIDWDSPGSLQTLRKLMELRFTQVLRSEPDEVITWDGVFSGETMTSRQKQYDYMLDRTFSRPRDMIQFCNNVLEQHKVGDLAARALNRFSKRDIFDARNEYSNYLRAELADEMHADVPEWTRYLELIKSIGVVAFNYEQFTAVYTRRKAELKITANQLEVLKALFIYSVIGYARDRGGRTGTTYVFAYKERSEPVFDETATRFRVHYGFTEVLELSTRRDSKQATTLKDIVAESKRKKPGPQFAGSLLDIEGS